MSLLLPAEWIPQDVTRSVLIALVAGVSVVEAVRPILDTCATDSKRALPLGLHWPNDVMLAGRKLAGILVEALPDRRHVVGIGVNTNNTAADAPPELRPRVATLRDATGAVCDQAEFRSGSCNDSNSPCDSSEPPHKRWPGGPMNYVCSMVRR